MSIQHSDTCDQKTLGWTALWFEERFGPDQAVSVSDLRQARTRLQETSDSYPRCECARLQLARLSAAIDTARKSGAAEQYAELLLERRELRERVRDELAKATV